MCVYIYIYIYLEAFSRKEFEKSYDFAKQTKDFNARARVYPKT